MKVELKLSSTDINENGESDIYLNEEISVSMKRKDYIKLVLELQKRPITITKIFDMDN